MIAEGSDEDKLVSHEECVTYFGLNDLLMDGINHRDWRVVVAIAVAVAMVQNGTNRILVLGFQEL